MKISREAMTPALDAALRAFVGDGIWYRLPPKSDGPPPIDVARELLKDDFERRSAAICAWAFCGLATLFSGLFRFLEIEHGVRNAQYALDGTLDLISPVGNVSLWIFALAGVLGAVGIGIGSLRRKVRPDGLTPRADFLAAVVDRLALAPVQRRYAEALAAVYGGKASDPGAEGLGLLRNLAEEEERLLALSPTVRSARAPEIDAEAKALRVRLDAAHDPGAREALAQSLALAESRVEAAIHADRIRERLDAHRSLLDQAAAAASEMIHGRGHVGPGLDDLRRNVASLGRDVTDLEAAIREMGESSRVGLSA